MGERKNCPFCGSEDVGVLSTFGMTYNIGCLSCGMLGPQGESEEEAEKHWNSLCDRLGCPDHVQPVNESAKKRLEAFTGRHPAEEN